MSIRRTIPLTGSLVLAALLLASCAGPAPKHPPGVAADTGWARAMKAGRTAFERGDLESAAGFYGAALSRGRIMDDASAIADAAYNLAACRVALGEYESARALLQEAKAEMSRSDREPGDVLMVEARVLRLLGETEEALSLTERLLGSLQTNATEDLHLQVRLLRGMIACGKGDTERAVAEHAMAETLGRNKSTHAANAGISELAGCISLLQGDPRPGGPAIRSRSGFPAGNRTLQDDGRRAPTIRRRLPPILPCGGGRRSLVQGCAHDLCSGRPSAGARLRDEGARGGGPGKRPEHGGTDPDAAGGDCGSGKLKSPAPGPASCLAAGNTLASSWWARRRQPERLPEIHLKKLVGTAGRDRLAPAHPCARSAGGPVGFRRHPGLLFLAYRPAIPFSGPPIAP